MSDLERMHADDLDPAGEAYEPTERGTLGMIRTMATAMGIVLPPSAMKVFGRQVKVMFKDEVPPDVITAAALLALRRGKPHLAQTIALDLQLAAAGARMSDAEYFSHLAMYEAAHRPRDLHAEHQQRITDRQAEIERRRGGER